jgi:hypothetical protein
MAEGIACELRCDGGQVGVSDLAAVELSEPALIWRISVAAPAHRRMQAAVRAFLDELLRDAPWRLTENRSSGWR